MKVVLLGPPGSGKGTQAAKLAEHFKVPHISTGDMFREVREQATPLGRMVKGIMDSGNLIDDATTDKVLDNRLEKKDAANGFILDGYPRNLGQAAHLEKVSDVKHVIELVVRDPEVVRRISSRWSCKDCKTAYNVLFVKPQNEGKCDKCGSDLFQREDDKADSVKERLRIYHERTEPLSNHYNEKGTLIRINGEQPIQKVFEDIVKALSD